MLSDDYLIKGITGMSRAIEEAGWVTGHYGAAVIATYYFCRDNELDSVTENAIKREIDKLIKKHDEFFKPVRSEKSDLSLLDNIPQSLEANISKPTRQGHNVIFATLAIKALKQMPDMITPEVIEGINTLIKAFNGKETKKVVGVDVSDVTLAGDDTIPGYTDKNVITEFTFNEFLQFEEVHCRGIRGEAGHLVTHAQSLIELSGLGYTELAQKGFDAHRLQAKMLRRIHKLGCEKPLPTPSSEPDPLKHDYWDTDLESKDWLFGHSFKYSFHLYDLLKYIDDARLKEEVIKQMGAILLHVYMEPPTN